MTDSVHLRTFVAEPGDGGFAVWANTFRDLDLACSVHYNEDGTRELVIDHAEPRTLIDADLVKSIARGESPYARLVWPDGLGPDSLFGSYVGALVRIEASNRTVIYGLRTYELTPDRYVAEWPD